MSEASHPDVEPAPAPRPATARAEETVDRLGERVGQLTVLLGHRVRVFAARAREEAEDIWAEAHSMRRPDGPV